MSGLDEDLRKRIAAILRRILITISVNVVVVLDEVALLIVIAYALLAGIAQWGGFAGVGLDPVWAAVQQRGTLRVVTDPGWRPFADMEGGQLVGYDIDLAREIGRRLHVTIEFKTAGYDAL